MYHLDADGQRITNLHLDQGTIVKIFTSGIRYWDDPEILAENPGVPLPHRPIADSGRFDSRRRSGRLHGGRPGRPRERPASAGSAGSAPRRDCFPVWRCR